MGYLKKLLLGDYEMGRKKEIKWEPDNFELQMTTVWSFPERGDWATHNSKYRGNWSPYIPRNLLLRYSQEGDLVLDQFAGGGTTLVEAKLLNRKIIGVDINPESLELCNKAVDFTKENCGEVNIKQGDARNLNFISDEQIDFICTHPPYANIIKYSEDLEGDLSHLKVPAFLEEMKKVAAESSAIIMFCPVWMKSNEERVLNFLWASSGRSSTMMSSRYFL
jgi:16S rRNA G966 N2-methylase RsmD